MNKKGDNMTVKDALNLDANRATKEQLKQANKILTRKFNRQMIALAYDDIGEKSASVRKAKQRYGTITAHLKGGNKANMYAYRSNVAFMQSILNRRDSSKRGYFKMVDETPRALEKNPEVVKIYSTLTREEKSRVWELFRKAEKATHLDQMRDIGHGSDEVLRIAILKFVEEKKKADASTPAKLSKKAKKELDKKQFMSMIDKASEEIVEEYKDSVQERLRKVDEILARL